MAELRTLECPTCGAPLDLEETGKRSLRCNYCSTSIVIPEELQHEKPEGIARSLHSNTIHLREIIKLLQDGRKIDAIRLYREQTGERLKESKEAVERLAEGKRVQVANFTIETQGFDSSAGQPINRSQPRKGKTKKAVLGCFLIGFLTVVVGVGIFFVALRMSGFWEAGALPFNIGKKPFAEEGISFGGEGTGEGLSMDARTITADGAGLVYLGDREFNRIQVFDENGTFVSAWIAGEKGYIGNMAADKEGNLFLIMSGKLYQFDGKTGDLIAEMQVDGCNVIEDIQIASNGEKTLLCGGIQEEAIIQVDTEGNVLHRITDAMSSALKDMDDPEMIALDGLGNIFVISDWTNSIFKFSPEGQMLSRFGGEGDEPDRFDNAQDIVVDGQGRVYVSDFFGVIRIFANDGRFIDTLETKGSVEGMALVNNYDLYVILNRHTVVRYALPQE